jgi:hypothetical protein
MTTPAEHSMITSPGPVLPACDSGSTYWTFSTMDGDVWYCGRQWTVEVSEMITETRSNGLVGSHQEPRLILLGRLSGVHGL